jgi:hypothetical protein
MPQGVDAPDGTARPMSTSKIGNTQIAIGAAGAAEAASKVSDALDQAKTVKDSAQQLTGGGDVLSHLLTMPTFWIAVAIVVAAGVRLVLAQPARGGGHLMLRTHRTARWVILGRLYAISAALLIGARGVVIVQSIR